MSEEKKYKIIKPNPLLRIYQVVSGDEIIKEFDDYNHQAPFRQARKYLGELLKVGGAKRIKQ